MAFTYHHTFELIKLKDEFLFYDRPLIYSFLSDNNELFLAYAYKIDRESKTSTWLYVPTTEDQISLYMGDEIKPAEFFSSCEYGYLVTIDDSTSKLITKKYLKIEDFPTDIYR